MGDPIPNRLAIEPQKHRKKHKKKVALRDRSQDTMQDLALDNMLTSKGWKKQ